MVGSLQFEGGSAAAGGEVGCGGVVAPFAGVDGSVSQSDGQHGLADPGRPSEEDVGGVLE
jgi:hypothetical protein